MLKFYAVTRNEHATSLYEVISDNGHRLHYPLARKLKLRGSSWYGAGHVMIDNLLVVGTRLFFCKSDGPCSGRDLVDGKEIVERSSEIVALFMHYEEANSCFFCDDLEVADISWINQTTEVLGEISLGVENVTLCGTEGAELLPRILRACA